MLSRLSLLALVPAAVALHPTQEKVDLSPRFEAGQELAITQSWSVEGSLEELSVLVNGEPMLGDGIAADFAMEGSIEISETIDEVRGNDIAKMHITYDTMDMAMTGEVDAMGNVETIDEPIEVPMTGRTFQLVIDEEGEVEATDVTEDVEPLDDGVLEGISEKNHFEYLLPEEPVAEGEEFTLGDGWKDFAMKSISSMDTSEMDADELEMAMAVAEAFIDATEIEATGKLTGVEEGMAAIEYEIVVTTNIDDLVGLIQSIAPEGAMDEVPPGIEAVLEITVEMAGSGKFDTALGQMTELELSGDFELVMDGNAEMDGMSGSASVLFAGEFSFEAGLEAL